MAIKVNAEIGKLNHIGRVGENQAEILVFNISKIIDNFGITGEFSLLVHQNGNLFTETSNLALNSTNKTLEWTITSTYTEVAAQGKCQIVYEKSGGIIVKSEIYDIIVTEAFEDEEGDE